MGGAQVTVDGAMCERKLFICSELQWGCGRSESDSDFRREKWRSRVMVFCTPLLSPITIHSIPFLPCRFLSFPFCSVPFLSFPFL